MDKRTKKSAVLKKGENKMGTSLNLGFDGLIKYYDSLQEAGAPICPIAHKYITGHIMTIINQEGKLLKAIMPDVKELACVPCTIESECRSSNVAPHLLHDKLMYVAAYSPKYAMHHDAYLTQLKNYVDQCPQDIYAAAIYEYVKKDTLMEDIKDILPEKLGYPMENLNVIFGVYGMVADSIDLRWTQWYLSQLKPNGTCSITGQRDYIPSAYPKCVTSIGGNEVLFATNSRVGYIASQKIIHALQYMTYGKKNYDKTEAEYKLRGFINGEIEREDLKQWVDEKYPGKWKQLIDLLTYAKKENEQ